MNENKFVEKICNSDYSFLVTEPCLGNNIVAIGLGGSHAYGTNTPDSDVDIRGIAVNSAESIILGDKFEQYVDSKTDTTIYAFDKIMSLFCSCNPNTIEFLGLRPQDVLYLHPIIVPIFQNKHLFLSKRAINSFGGYANAQLRRLENKSANNLTQPELEQYIMKSIEHASVSFKDKFFDMPEDAIKLYIDASERDELDTEIFMDVTLKHYPLRDWKGMWADMNNIVKAYAATGHRNMQAIMHNKIAKHMMHLVRLYLMAFDILENGEIVTYREKDHDFLMSIRNGAYLNDNDVPTKEFRELVDELEHKFDVLKNATELPDKPDMRKIQKMMYDVNMSIVDGRFDQRPDFKFLTWYWERCENHG